MSSLADNISHVPASYLTQTECGYPNNASGSTFLDFQISSPEEVDLNRELNPQTMVCFPFLFLSHAKILGACYN